MKGKLSDDWCRDRPAWHAVANALGDDDSTAVYRAVMVAVEERCVRAERFMVCGRLSDAPSGAELWTAERVTDLAWLFRGGVRVGGDSTPKLAEACGVASHLLAQRFWRYGDRLPHPSHRGNLNDEGAADVIRWAGDVLGGRWPGPGRFPLYWLVDPRCVPMPF